MSPHQFADLASIVARHAEELCGSSGTDSAALHRIWKRAVRCFRAWREELVTSATPDLYAEVFSAELMVRVWCTAAAGSDRYGQGKAGPAVAAKVFADLLDMRCMALQALAADHGLSSAEAAGLDRFRRRCERWADVLIGPLVAKTGVADYAFRPERAADYSDSVGETSGESFWPLVTGGLRIAFKRHDDFGGRRSEQCLGPAEDLAVAILAGFPSASFDLDGRFRSPILARVSRTVAERRPAKSRSPIRQQTTRPESAPTEPPDMEAKRPSISFASLRKRRHKE